MFSVYDKIEKNTFSIARHPFSRRGAYFGLVARPQRHTLPRDIGLWGSSELYIASGRGGAAALTSNLCMLLVPVHHGQILPYAIHTTPTEMTLHTAYGDIKMCFAEPSLLLIRGENGLGLLLETDLVLHKILRQKGVNSWERTASPACSFMFTPVQGDIDMNAKWDLDRLSTPQVRGKMLPDETGEFLLAVEEFAELGYVRDSYPSYAEGLADAQADWEDFLAHLPSVPACAEGRETAAYLMWSMLSAPSLLLQHPQMFGELVRPAAASQLCLSAAALSGDLELAIGLLLNQLDRQSPDGQLPAMLDDTRTMYQYAAAPLQGWLLEYLMRKYDLKRALPAQTLTRLYEGLAKWAAWYDACRDDDKDGIPQYEGSCECGYEGSPVFRGDYAVELPDLCALLALLEEKVGDLAGMLGLDEQKKVWYDKSRTRIERMIQTFWNGTRFVGRVHGSGTVLAQDSLLFFRPLILGKRLPQEIIDAMAEELTEGNGFMTPCGITTHRMTGKDFSRLLPGAGQITGAENVLIATGLLWAGKSALAKQAAAGYCGGVLHPVSGFYPVSRGIDGSGTAAAFQILGELTGAGE